MLQNHTSMKKNTKHILRHLSFLVAGTALLASEQSLAKGAERESFDFDWIFKYFGSGDPLEDSLPVKASSSQSGNPAANALDGNMSTRWCAAKDGPGHSLTIKISNKEKVGKVVIHWEDAKPQELDVKVDYADQGGGKVYHISKNSNASTVEMEDSGHALKQLVITLKKTGANSWASIREVKFYTPEGKDIIIQPTGKESAPAQLDYKTKGFKKVQLPHDWAIESPFLVDEPNETGKLPWNGYGWYRKGFDIPEDFNAEKDRYYLDFDGVMSHPKVYVNGKLAGEWAYGYASFRVDITPFLKPGKNLVAVMASNKPISTRWYPGAGIYRHVWLQKNAPVHVAYNGIFVTTPEITDSQATVKVQTEVVNTGKTPAEIKIKQSIKGAGAAKEQSVTLSPGETRTVEQTFTISKPKLWSCEEPNLYAVKTSLTQGAEEIDSHSTNFGVRTMEWRPEGFFLNGKRVPLNGVCEHHDLGALGAAFHERGFERKIEILKAMGCNSIRTSHNPPAPGVLDLCDKHGILLLDELFDIWKYQKYDKRNGYHVDWEQWWKKDVANFIRRDRNHPCVIAWSGGNEIIEIVKPDGVQISADLRAEILKHDPTRAYTVGTNDARGAWNGFGDTQDAFGYNYKPWLYREYAQKRPNKAFYGSETASCVATRDTYFFPLRWNVGGGASAFQVSAYGLFAPGWGYCPDAEFAGQDSEPRVAGEYVWTGFDYIGEPTPYNQDASNVGNLNNMSEAEKKAIMDQLHAMGNKAPSRSSYFGIIDLAGFPKDTYYLYQSRWAPQVKQAHLLPHWNWKGREGEVTPVMCFSSGDEAELFLNGKSQGVRRKGEGEKVSQGHMQFAKNAYRFVWEDVKYQPGEIKVVVKKDGKPWAEDKRVTTGSSTAVKASVDRPTIAGDGHDLAYISLALVDAKGNVVPTDSRAVEFSIQGPADLVGFCNGNPIDQTCMQDLKQSFFNGRILAIVRSQRGGQGKAKVTVRAKGLPAVKVPVQVGSADQ